MTAAIDREILRLFFAGASLDYTLRKLGVAADYVLEVIKTASEAAPILSIWRLQP